MDDFWDDVLAMGIYQMEVNEDTNPVREFYTLNQAKEYLKTQFPSLYFDDFEIVELMKKGELELRLAFKDEIALAEAWPNEKSSFMGDDGLEYKLDTVVVSNNPLSAFEMKFTSSQGDEMLNHIYQTIRGNHVTHVSTKYNILLRRNDRYWKVVDCHIFESAEVKNCPKCFIKDVTWGISAKSLEQYRRGSDSKPTQEQIERWKNLFLNEGWSLRKIIEVDGLNFSDTTLQNYTGTRKSHKKDRWRNFKPAGKM
jgi:hypothetical protein